MQKLIRIGLLVILDAVIINASYIMAYLLRFEFEVDSAQFTLWFSQYANNILPITAIIIISFVFLGIYTSMWRYAGTQELMRVVMACLLGQLLVLAYVSLAQQMVPRSIYIIAGLLMMVMVGGSRILYRILRSLRTPGAFKSMASSFARPSFVPAGIKKVMIIGAGDAGASIIREMKLHPEYGKKAVAVIDDNPAKAGSRINGVKVFGNTEQIRLLARRYQIDEIIVAIPSASRKTIQKIVNECNKTKAKIKILPALIDLINENVSISKLRDVDIEDLLGRDPVKVNLREIAGYLENQIVLVTGGGGSIGSELCRQIASFKPRKLIALDIYENSLYEFENEIKRSFPYLEFESVVASVRDKERLRQIFEKYRPHVVFHAAAHKHVPLMEESPGEALVNNILGSKNVMDLSDEYLVTRFVMISTDKAVKPTNVMGATKRLSEMILQEKSKEDTKTTFSAVRFGNVLGSNGSVIPIFRKQIELGGPVTVTHPEVTRYFMTIPEAVQLVIQTGAMAKGGEIFILDMGEAVKIMDLAENVIRLSGYVPGVDIDIEITGLRPGEKLYEELLLQEEGILETSHEKIFVANPLEGTERLREFLKKDDDFEAEVKKVAKEKEEDIRTWLKGMVPFYNPNGNGETLDGY